MYVILREGATVTESYCGWAKRRDHAGYAAERAGGGAQVFETTREGISKIEAQVALEREYLETLRTGLGRKTRGVTSVL